jgi:hypothetical protein
MSAKKRAKELFIKFREIPPSSPFTGIDDGEAKECVRVLISILQDELKGTIDPTGNYEYDGTFYEQVLLELNKI